MCTQRHDLIRRHARFVQQTPGNQGEKFCQFMVQALQFSISGAQAPLNHALEVFGQRGRIADANRGQ
jgi:hypothetical protein